MVAGIREGGHISTWPFTLRRCKRSRGELVFLVLWAHVSFQVFFIIPCLDIYQKIDMRTATYDVPPQEVSEDLDSHQNFQCFPRSDPDEGQCDSFCECHNVLQGELEKLANPPIINLTNTKQFKHFYRTQVSLGSGLWVPVSLTPYKYFVKLNKCDSGWWWYQLNTS